jgi:quercetin dioxygenase-like cupin family protein
MSRVALVMILLCLAAAGARAQDPVKVDAKHYQVVLENAQVRVLRIRYGPHEKSVMHRHPAAVGVFLTAQDGRFTLPGGKTVERHAAAGDAQWMPAETHLPENLSDQPLELILVEMKAKPGAGHGK